MVVNCGCICGIVLHCLIVTRLSLQACKVVGLLLDLHLQAVIESQLAGPGFCLESNMYILVQYR